MNPTVISSAAAAAAIEGVFERGDILVENSLCAFVGTAVGDRRVDISSQTARPLNWGGGSATYAEPRKTSRDPDDITSLDE